MSSRKQIEYSRYLQTKAWKEKRDSFRRAWGNKCAMCNKTENLHMHHLNYDNLGSETIDDVICLCKGCHLDYHKGRLKIWQFTQEEREHFEKIRHIVIDPKTTSYLFLTKKANGRDGK